MRSLIGFSIVLLFSSVLPAQNRSGFVNTPGVTRSFGSVVFPGGTSALRGVQRTTGSVVFPGGGGPQIGVPAPPLQGLGFTNFSNHNNGIPGIGFGGNRFIDRRDGRRRNNNNVVFAYPLSLGGYGDYYSGYYDNGYANGYPYGYGAAAPSDVPLQQSQQPNVFVIYPPANGSAGAYPVPQSAVPGYPPEGFYPPPSPQAAAPAPPEDQATRYLIAFKDHTIYSAVAYWVEGDTLHYFTSGNTHNQASLSLVDRPLTEKLNQDSGMEVKLPPAK